MKKFFTVCMFISVVVLSGCETMKGVGKDVQKAGGAIEKAAK